MFVFFINYFIIIFHLFKRKRGRPPKTKSSDGPTPIASYTKHTHVNPTGITLTPTMNNQVIINDQILKVNIPENNRI